ncbi:hypothetical protein HDU93_005217 [Gonapodya sp. JEL0774]|nr:hypothetical protein HDU93_005217 [Gonapodya sp. JEL0774]
MSITRTPSILQHRSSFQMRGEGVKNDRIPPKLYFNRTEESIAGVFYVMRGDRVGPTSRKSMAITIVSFLVDFLQVLAITVGSCPSRTVPNSTSLTFFDNGNIWRLLAEGQLNAFIAVQFILCALVLTVVGVTVYVAWSFKDRVVRWLWPVELLRLFVGVFVGAFLILITDTLLMPFQCDYIHETFSKDYDCASPLSLTLMASSALALLFYLPLALLSAWLFFDYNPKAKRSESKAHGRAEVWNTVGRVVSVQRRDFAIDQLLFETDFYLVFRHIVVAWTEMTGAEKISALTFLRVVYSKLDKRNGPEAGWFLFSCAVIEFHLANEIERSREFLARAKACHPPWDVIVAIYSLSRDMQTAKEAALNDGRPLSITEQMSHKKFFDAATTNHNAIYATAHKMSKIMDLKRTSPEEVSTLVVTLVRSVKAAEQAYAVLCAEFPDNPLALRLRAKFYDQVFHDSHEALRLEAQAQELEQNGGEMDLAVPFGARNRQPSLAVTRFQANFGYKSDNQLVKASKNCFDFMKDCNVHWLLMLEDRASYEDPVMFETHRNDFRQTIDNLRDSVNQIRDLTMRNIGNYSYANFQDVIPSPELTFAIKYKADERLLEWCLKLIDQQAVASDTSLQRVLTVNKVMSLFSLGLVVGIGALVINLFHYTFRRIGRKSRRVLIDQLAHHRDIIVDFSKTRPVLATMSEANFPTVPHEDENHKVIFSVTEDSVVLLPAAPPLIEVPDEAGAEGDQQTKEDPPSEISKDHALPRSIIRSASILEEGAIHNDEKESVQGSTYVNGRQRRQNCFGIIRDGFEHISNLIFYRPYTRVLAFAFLLFACSVITNMVVMQISTSDLDVYNRQLVLSCRVEYWSLRSLFFGMFVVDDNNLAMDQLVNGGDVVAALVNSTTTFLHMFHDLVFGSIELLARDYPPRKDLLFKPRCLYGRLPCHTDLDAYPMSSRAEDGLYPLVRQYVSANELMMSLYKSENPVKIGDDTWQFIVNVARKDLSFGLAKLTGTFIDEKDNAMDGM